MMTEEEVEAHRARIAIGEQIYERLASIDNRLAALEETLEEYRPLIERVRQAAERRSRFGR